jgi:hypothetical protein
MKDIIIIIIIIIIIMRWGGTVLFKLYDTVRTGK